MKTFILNVIKRLENYSQKLDAKAILFDKSWEVFNETGDKELIIFRTNSELLISRNGIVQKGKWELLDIANLLIDMDNKSYLLNAAYIEDKFLALKLDGTQQFMVMIETDMKNRFSMNSINVVEKYLEDRYKRIEEEQKRLAQQQMMQLVAAKAEQKRLAQQKMIQLVVAIAEKKRREEIRQTQIKIEETKRIQAEIKEKEKRELIEKEQRKVREQNIRDWKKKKEYVAKYAKENPTKYRRIVKEYYKEYYNSIDYSKEISLIQITYVISTLIFILGFGLISTEEHEVFVIIGYFFMFPGMIFALWLILSFEEELIYSDLNPSKRSLSLFLNFILLISSIFTIYLIFNNFGLMPGQSTYLFFACACIGIKCILSIFKNAKSIIKFYKIISDTDKHLEHTLDIYDKLTRSAIVQ